MGGVASLVDVNPLHVVKGHELGGGFFYGKQGRTTHEVGLIIGAWRRHAMHLVVKICGDLVSSDGCKLVTGEGSISVVVHSIDEGHKFNEALCVCFSCM